MSKFKIALVEDDQLISKLIKINLEKEKLSVKSFQDGESFLDDPNNHSYDLLILDLFLPGISGMELLTNLRKKNILTPVLLLTVEKDVQSKVEAFIKGADDYITKPFNLEELLGRIRAILRRVYDYSSPQNQNIIQINNFTINLLTRKCDSNLGPQTLSSKEIKLLKYFSANQRKNLRRADILEEVWGMDVFPTPRTIDNFVLKFRKLFETDPKNPQIFLSIRDIGYNFNLPQ